MTIRSKEFVLVSAVFALVVAFPIGHTVWERYQKKLNKEAQTRLQERSREWAIEILAEAFGQTTQKKSAQSEAYWDGWVQKHVDSQYRADCRRIGTHLAFNRELCDRDLGDIPEPAMIPLFFEAQGSDGKPVLDVEHIASTTPTGMFAITWLDSHGYLYSTDARDAAIKRNGDNLHPPVSNARGR